MDTDHRSTPTENPLDSIDSALAFSSRDHSLDKRDAWIYGIVCGWGDSLDEVADDHGWDAEARARLRRLQDLSEAEDARLAGCR